MRTFILFILIACTLPGISQQSYDTYFTEKVLRFDFMFSGNSVKTTVYPVGFKEEPKFAGSRVNLIDPFNSGNFKYEVYDDAGNKLIYSKGFCTLYQEWQTTDEAKKIERSFYEVATMPFPKNKIRIKISVRERNGMFTQLYETRIDPEDYFIRKEKTVNANYTKISGQEDPSISVDLAFIAEGYTAGEILQKAAWQFLVQPTLLPSEHQILRRWIMI